MTLYLYNGKKYNDISSNIPGLHVVHSLDYNGSYWLIGGTGLSSLYSYDNITYNDISSSISGITDVYSLDYNGSYWLIGGGGLFATSSLYSYDGTNFTDLTVNVPGITDTYSISHNNSHWFIGGYGTARLYSYDGIIYNDISFNIPGMNIADESIAWGSNFWLIGGEGTDILYQATQTYQLNALALSTSVVRTGGLITRATLESNEELNGGTIDYYLSADGGVNWQHASEVVFDNPGQDLRWKAELSTLDNTKSPQINLVTITYTVEEELPYTGK